MRSFLGFVGALAIAELAYFAVGLAVLTVAPLGVAQLAGAAAWCACLVKLSAKEETSDA